MNSFRFHQKHVVDAHSAWWQRRKAIREESAREAVAAAPRDFERRRRVPALGERFGDLTVVEFLGKRFSYGRNQSTWRCTCSCGESVERTTGDLHWAVRRGLPLRCRTCAQEERRTTKAHREALVAEAFRRQWVDYGTAWTPEQTAKLVSDIRNDLIAEFGDEAEWVPRTPIVFDKELIWGTRARQADEPEEGNEEPSFGRWAPSKAAPLSNDELMALASLEES